VRTETGRRLEEATLHAVDTSNVARFMALCDEAIRRHGDTIRWGSQVLVIERTPEI
jgi:hypothetical protein